MKGNIVILLLFFQIVGCQNKKNNYTSNQFISKINSSKEIYSKDSLSLVLCIKDEILYKRGGYNAYYYNQNTPILIDTIIYSPNLDRIVFFAIDSIENKLTYPKSLSSDEIEKMEKIGNLPYKGYHYNGYAYIAKRIGDSFDIHDFSKRYTGKYKEMNDLRNRLRQKYFVGYSKIQGKGFEYNIGDKRFWNNPNVWDVMEKDKKNGRNSIN